MSCESVFNSVNIQETVNIHNIAVSTLLNGLTFVFLVVVEFTGIKFNLGNTYANIVPLEYVRTKLLPRSYIINTFTGWLRSLSVLGMMHIPGIRSNFKFSFAVLFSKSSYSGWTQLHTWPLIFGKCISLWHKTVQSLSYDKRKRERD